MITGDDELQLAYLLSPTFQALNSAGKPLTGGYIEVYLHGTRTKYYCYSDWNGSLHPFQIPLDSLGSNIVLASPIHSYDVYIYNKFGTLVMSRYNVIPSTNSDEAIADIVVITSNDNTINVSSSGGTNWDLSIQDTVDRVEQNEQDISDIKGDIEDIQEDISGKKDKQSSKSYNGSPTKTVTNISQDANGVITVTYGDIDLPPEVPNVEITSEDNSIQVTESTDVQTNTKTFDLSVNVDDPLEYGQFRATNVTGQAQLAKIKGNLDLSNYAIKLKKGNSYHFTVRGSYVATSAANTYNTITYIEYSSFNGININVDNTITDSQYFEISYDIYNYSNSGDYNISFAAISSGKVSDLWVEVHNLNGVSVNGGGSGGSYTAGDAIDITNNTISVKYNNYNDNQGNYFVDFGGSFGIADSELSINQDNELLNTVTWLNVKLPTILAGDGVELTDSTLPSGVKAKTIDVKVGNGLEIDEDNNVIKLDSVTEDVVETVEKLKSDLDTQITVNFDMPNISQAYDFANPSVSTMANGACMLCQAFTIPINHEIRTVTDDADTPTLLGIYAQQNFAHKIMLALYEYTYAAEGEEHGSSTYVGDTGPVTVVQGVNEYPLKNRNPSITELRSDKVYYATLYLPSTALVNGLLLAGAPNYGSASIPAEPRLTCGVDNITWDGQELDMNDPTTTLNHYQEVIIPGQPIYYQYYIGPWQSGYNERQTAPRFYMQIRNGEYNVPVVPTTPFIDLGDALPHGTADQSNIPSFSPSQSNSAFRDVTPLMNVTITAFEWIDGMQNAAGWAAGNCVYDSGFANNLSGVSNSVVDLGQVVTGSNPGYAHRITFTTPLTLTAGTTYRFLCGCTDGSPYFKVWLDPTDVIHVGNNGWYVVDTNVLRIDHQMGMYNKLYDNQNNHYVI